MNILTRYFKPWVVEDLGRDGLYYDIAYSGSMLLAGILMPALGAISDNSGKKKFFLFLFTIVCCSAIGIISFLPPMFFIFAVLLFAFSNFFYEGGMVFYNTLLYSVAEGKEARFVSGFGVAMGYLGAIIGLMIMLPIVYGDIFGWDIPGMPGWGKKASFIPTAIIFFIFSLPTFIWVKEKQYAKPIKNTSLANAYKEVWEGIRDTRKYPGVVRFLIADYFFEDAVATVILNIGIFCSLVLGLKGSNIDLFLIISTISAMLGAYIIGRISVIMNLKAIMNSIIWGWVIILGAFILIDNIILVYIMGSLIGILMGGLWTVSRPLLAEMVPPQELGRFFGLYALSGKAAAIVGPVVWGVVVYLFNPLRPLGIAMAEVFDMSPESAEKLPYKLAILSLVFMMMIGLFIFRKVPRSGRSREVVSD